MKKKIILGVIILVLVIAVAVEGVFIYKLKTKKEPLSDEKASNTEEGKDIGNKINVFEGENITVIEARTPQEPEGDNSDIRPYDAYTYAYYNVDLAYQYYIPQIYLNLKDGSREITEDIKRINTEIREEWTHIIEEMKETQQMNMSKEGLEYNCYYDDDIMTLELITHIEAGGGPVLKIYSIDKNTGKEISNEELLERYNLSVDEVKARLIEIIDEYSKKRMQDFNIDDTDGFYKELVEKAKKEVREMSIDDMELFVSNNLSIYLETYNLRFAGGDGGQFVFDLETGEESLEYYM